MQPIYTMSLFLGPTLAANHTFSFKVPFDCTLVAVSLVNSTANAGTFKIGTTSDDDAYLTATNFGVSGSPVVKKAMTDFAGVTANSQFPRFAADATVMCTVTDHVSHMANVAVVLFFAPG